MRLIKKSSYQIMLVSVCFGVFLAAIFIFRDARKKHQPTIATPQPSAPPSIEKPATVHTVSESVFPGPVVHYDGTGFSPAAVSLGHAKEHATCLIKIINDSPLPLTLRLSPHERALKGNYGWQYEPITPGDSIIIDPRFGKAQTGFHDHEQPARGFAVSLGSACQ